MPDPARPARAPRGRRAVAAMTCLATGSVLGTARALAPAAEGLGTHTQMGMPPCGFEVATRLPCATCGMTTAFAHAVRGELIAAFAVQPAGAALALATGATLILGALALAGDADLAGLVRPLLRPWSAVPVLGLVLAAWAYKLWMASGGPS